MEGALGENPLAMPSLCLKAFLEDIFQVFDLLDRIYMLLRMSSTSSWTCENSVGSNQDHLTVATFEKSVAFTCGRELHCSFHKDLFLMEADIDARMLYSWIKFCKLIR